MALTELTPDQIAEVQAASSQRAGHYRSVLTDFANSDMQGADVTDEFSGKKTSSAVQALKRYVTTQSEFDGIRVAAVNDRIYLIRG